MTQRQKNIGVSNFGLEMLKVYGCISCVEAFLAAMSTHKKGQFRGIDICKELFNENDEELANIKMDDVRPLLTAVSHLAPRYFSYTNTLGLDTFNIR